MTYCENCERDTSTAHDMAATGVVVEICASCAFKRTATSRKAEPAPIAAIAPIVTASPSLRAASGVDEIEAHLRARLAAVEVEIERMTMLRAERTRLRRMLAAAERKR